MTITTEIKKTATEYGYAVVGITDVAVERVRRAQAKAQARVIDVRTELERVDLDAELKKLQAKVQHVPTAAVTLGLEVAGKAEETYGELAGRGKTLVARIKRQRATTELVRQGEVTVSRTKAAVTTVRRGADETGSTAAASIATTASTARKRAATSKRATKATVTSAKRTASGAAKATKAAADKVGN
jgi:hypothetical protein